MNLSELTNEELDRIAAVEVMRWYFVPRGPSGSDQWRTVADLGSGDYVMRSKDWHPCTDRNQSRMVVETAVKKQGTYGDVENALMEVLGIEPGCDHDYEVVGRVLAATPRQEVEASILAVRAIKGENDGQG